ncbi:hypothetical protein H6A05_10040 [Megasphaera elsdenii]|uniref:hypothetical protein n=1 Tax=Megasphaera elsdenii TaxID=907 RepID=UPI0019564E98|nr:hypothetical protein [Megasphaera elsdenii]MBM6702623.1 hypothetical protein [Megasphaera elsdenii]
MNTDKLGQVIYEKALACGFDDCGIIPIDDMDGFQQRLQEREEKVPSSAFFIREWAILRILRNASLGQNR